MTKGKKILFLIITGVFVLLLASYSLAIKKTVELSSNCSQLQNKIDSAKMAPAKLEQLRKEVAVFEGNFGKIGESSIEFQTRLIQIIGDFCETHNMEIFAFPTPHEYINKSLNLITYQCCITGKYVDQLRLLEMLEKQQLGAKIVSVYFETKKNIRTKKTKLYMTMYIQKIQEHEEV